MANPDHYDPQYFPPTYAAEQQHFWFRYRNEVIGDAARRAWRTRGRAAARVLEVGCGTGNVLPVLEASCPGAHVTGIELFPEGLQFARSRTGASLVCARVEALPFRASFGLIGLFDVLEHIPEDIAALQHLAAVLADDGALLLTVPAHQALWSDFDRASGHVRRYSPDSLRDVARRAGFRIARLTQFMMPLLPLVWINRRLVRRGASSDPIRRELHVPALLNAVMLATLRIEGAWLAQERRIPRGTSILALLRKN